MTTRCTITEAHCTECGTPVDEADLDRLESYSECCNEPIRETHIPHDSYMGECFH